MNFNFEIIGAVLDNDHKPIGIYGFDAILYTPRQILFSYLSSLAVADILSRINIDAVPAILEDWTIIRQGCIAYNTDGSVWSYEDPVYNAGQKLRIVNADCSSVLVSVAIQKSVLASIKSNLRVLYKSMPPECLITLEAGLVGPLGVQADYRRLSGAADNLVDWSNSASNQWHVGVSNLRSKQLILPYGVASVSWRDFNNCDMVETLIVPSSVRKFSFNKLPASLKNIIFLSENNGSPLELSGYSSYADDGLELEVLDFGDRILLGGFTTSFAAVKSVAKPVVIKRVLGGVDFHNCKFGSLTMPKEAVECNNRGVKINVDTLNLV